MADLNDLFRRSPVAQLVANPTVPAATKKNSVPGPMTSEAAAKELPKVSTLSLNLIMKTTPKVFKDNADNVVVKSLKRGKTRSGYSGIKAVTKDIFGNPKSNARKRSHKCAFVSMDGKPIFQSKAVHCSCDCVAGDTKVLTDRGYQPIYELAEPYVPGHYPLKYNINGRLYKGSAPFYKGRQKVYEVSFKNGMSVKATADHEFLVDNGHEYKNHFIYGDGPKQYSHSERVSRGKSWVELRELDLGDHVVLNSFTPKTATSDSKMLDGFFLGVMMGDGTMSTRRDYARPDLQLYKHDASEIMDLVAQSGTIASVRDNGYGQRATFNNRARELLARHKYVNKQSVDVSDYSLFLGYVAGLFVTDGATHRNGMKINGGDYLKHMQEMFLTFGFHDCSLVLDRTAGTRTNLGVSTKDMYRLTLGVSSIRKLLPLIGHLITEQKLDRLNAIAAKKAQVRSPSTEIVSIKYAGEQDVYDIDVPGPTRFAANGVIVHNCEAFMYWCEVALHRKGAASLKYSNGDMPDTRNPQYLPMICKHLIALAHVCRDHRF